MRKKLLFLIAALSIIMVGCVKEGEDTIALISGEEIDDYIPTGEIPDEIIPIEVAELFKKYMPINEGVKPPFIEGEFVSDPHEMVYDSHDDWEPGHVFADKYIRFKNQLNNGTITYNALNANQISEATDVHIIGEGDNFTAYFVSFTEEYDNNGEIETWCKRSEIMSGTITEEGVKDFYYAFIMLEKYDPNDDLMDVNQFRVIKDGDGLASRTTWPESKESISDLSGKSLDCETSKQ